MRNHHYHPTTQLTPQLRIDYEVTAANQDEAIFRFMQANAHRSFAAHEIRDEIGQSILITSIRRALTNLCTAHRIKPAGERPGEHGRNVTAYTIK